MGTAPDSPQLDRLLQSSSARWAAATNRTSSAASLELDARVPVMGIGGFSNDPTPTLAQFQNLVKQRKIHYFIDGGGFPGGGSDSTRPSSQITQWVEQNFTAKTVDGVTTYDLTAPK